MATNKHRLSLGTKLYWDGESHVVTGFTGSAVELRSSKGRTSKVALPSLVESSDFRVIPVDTEADDSEVTTFPDNVPPAALKRARQLLSHLLEARTGYQMGNAASALPGEPRAEYDPDVTSLMQRMEAKALELGRKSRWLFELHRRYEQQGLYGLIDHRATKVGRPRIDDRIRVAAQAVLEEVTDLSNVSKNQIRRRTDRKLKQEYPGVEVTLPSKATFNRLLNVLARGRSTFGSAKARRSIANRPRAAYSHFAASRPGEMVLIDSTPLDAYALDPYSFRWVQIQLTIAYDLFSRSILAWRFTPVSTKAVDAALLLYDIVRPKLMRPGWPGSARWPYVGVPESFVLEIVDDAEPMQQLAGIPFIHPESVLVDRGRVFLSQAFTDGCTRLGINLFIARPLTPTDKAHVERVFRSIRESFVEHLPGYKGPDVFSRGAAVEDSAFYFLDEIDVLFAEWVATYWQRRHHDGLELPCLPLLHVSPNEMYEEGIARAGFVYLVPDIRLYYELLPTEWRTIQHYGVEVRGLRYDGDILNDFRNQPSPYGGLHAGKWPLRYDPRDHSRVFFFDHTLEEWHELHWIGQWDTPRPFDEATVSYAKSLVVARGGNAQNHEELQLVLNELLNRIDDGALAGRKERKLAAINAMHTSLAKRDRPGTAAFVPPDSPSTIVPDGPLISLAQPADPDPESTPQNLATTVFRTVNEAMEDDDDELAL